MTSGTNETFVISLGGSLVVPDAIDASFIREFVQLIQSLVEGGKRFFIITGGGKICRRYQQALDEVIDATDRERDWIGIYTTRLNARLIQMSFQDTAHEDIIFDPALAASVTKPVAIGAGWKPGWSTDYVAVSFAKTVGASTIVNLSNIEYVYDKDPNQYPDAAKIEDITWSEFRKLLPEEWSPGLNMPFDPVAAREAESLGLTVAVLNKQMENIRNYFANESFIGTTIS